MFGNKLTKLRKENDKNIKTLNEKQREEINTNTQYVRAKGVSHYDSEMLRKDLISMYFERQIRNESFTLSDAKEFCDTFVENCPKYKIEPLLYILYHFAGIGLGYLALDFSLAGSSDTTIAHVFRDILVIAFLVIAYYVFPRFKLTSTTKQMFAYTFLLLAPLTVFYTIAARSISSYVIFTIPMGIRFGVQLLFFIIMYVVWNRFNSKLAEGSIM